MKPTLSEKEAPGAIVTPRLHDGSAWVSACPLPDTAPLSPSDALTYILKTIRDRGWEMPERSRLTRRYGPDGESLYVCWNTDCAEMDIGDGCDWRGNIRVKVLRGYLEIRRWQDVNKANIDAALGFLLGNEAAE